MNLSRLKELVRLVEESDIDEIEVSRWGQRVRVTKNRRQQNGPRPGEAVAAAGIPDTVVTPARAVPAPPAPEPPPAANVPTLKAPMVGTFYRASSPDARPFVEVGDVVQAGTVVCIIEAMKLMNEIQTDVSGRIATIDVENGQPVEFGQVLFRIAPA